MKIIKLTENDLIQIIKKVVKESKETLNEQIVIDNVKISPTNSIHGGPVSLEYNGVKTKYSVSVKVSKFGVTIYDGKIGVIAIWKKGSDIWAKDNTNKLFKLDQKQINKMVKAAKSNDPTFTIAGVGEVKGISGDYNATLTRIV
jgi:hypothetical protein